MRIRAEICLVSLVVTMQAMAAEPPSVPDPDMIEFIGSWETEDGDWIDPFALLDDAIARDRGRRRHAQSPPGQHWEGVKRDGKEKDDAEE